MLRTTTINAFGERIVHTLVGVLGIPRKDTRFTRASAQSEKGIRATVQRAPTVLRNRGIVAVQSVVIRYKTNQRSCCGVLGDVKSGTSVAVVVGKRFVVSASWDQTGLLCSQYSSGICLPNKSVFAILLAGDPVQVKTSEIEKDGVPFYDRHLPSHTYHEPLLWWGKIRRPGGETLIRKQTRTWLEAIHVSCLTMVSCLLHNS